MLGSMTKEHGVRAETCRKLVQDSRVFTRVNGRVIFRLEARLARSGPSPAQTIVA